MIGSIDNWENRLKAEGAAEPRQQLFSDSGWEWGKKYPQIFLLQSFCLSLEQGQLEMK